MRLRDKNGELRELSLEETIELLKSLIQKKPLRIMIFFEKGGAKYGMLTDVKADKVRFSLILNSGPNSEHPKHVDVILSEMVYEIILMG